MKQCLMSTILICISLFFLTVTTQAQMRIDTNSLNDLNSIKLAVGCKNGTGDISKDDAALIQEKALAALEEAFEKLDQAALSDSEIKQLENYLPKPFNKNLSILFEIAQSNISTEDKVETLVHSSGASCDEIIYAAIVVEVLSLFNLVPYLGLVGQILFAAAVLCYLGLI